jgi:uncharacterized damage-inducible protein DinB
MSTSTDSRIQASAAAFETVADAFVTSMERLSDQTAAVPPASGGWTPAQIAMHLALANELFAGVLSGAVGMAQPAATGFAEDPLVFSRVPDKVTTFPSLEPPSGVNRTEALERLRRANEQLLAAIEALPTERATGQCVQLSFGTITLHQFAEFAGAHMIRHTAQLQRALASA